MAIALHTQSLASPLKPEVARPPSSWTHCIISHILKFKRMSRLRSSGNNADRGTASPFWLYRIHFTSTTPSVVAKAPSSESNDSTSRASLRQMSSPRQIASILGGALRSPFEGRAERWPRGTGTRLVHPSRALPWDAK